MHSDAWPDVLETLIDGRDLPAGTTAWAMTQIMSGQATAAQLAGFLVGLRGKGVTGAEVATLVDVMLAHAVTVTVPGLTVDTCGTGGDNAGSANISTMAAVVVAACGERVVKHGNRAASSQAGSADVLEALGIAIGVPADRIAECVDRCSIAFCFAPSFHPAMRFAGPVRKELGIRTVFNVLGPLANPARPAAQIVGVADASMAPVVAGALAERGTSALVVRGEDGLDEISVSGPTRVWDCRGGQAREQVVDAADLGIPRESLEVLAGGDATRNAEIARGVLGVTAGEGLRPLRDAVALNAAAALVVAESARSGVVGVLESELGSQLARARSALESGEAAAILDTWGRVSRELAE